MKSLAAFTLSLFGLAIGMGTTILVAIYGWGLEPKSWGWIIGMYLIGQISALLIIEIAKGIARE